MLSVLGYLGPLVLHVAALGRVCFGPYGPQYIMGTLVPAGQACESSAGSCQTGRVKKNLEPLPGSLSTCRVLWCASTMSLASISPTPKTLVIFWLDFVGE